MLIKLINGRINELLAILTWPCAISFILNCISVTFLGRSKLY